MILEASFAAVTTYIAAGIAMGLRGPLARKRKQEAFGTALMISATGQQAPRKKTIPVSCRDVRRYRSFLAGVLA